MRGPKPTPTALKKLAGNPGKRALPKNEPEPAGLVARPDWLNVGARKVWEEYAPRLERLGLLTELDGDTLGQWCTLAAEFRASPEEMSANRIARMDALQQRFGMDPGSRTRIQVKPKEPMNDEARFFGTG